MRVSNPRGLHTRFAGMLSYYLNVDLRKRGELSRRISPIADSMAERDGFKPQEPLGCHATKKAAELACF